MEAKTSKSGTDWKKCMKIPFLTMAIFIVIFCTSDASAQFPRVFQQNDQELIERYKIRQMDVYKLPDSTLEETFLYDSTGNILSEITWLEGKKYYTIDYFYKDGRLLKEEWNERNDLGIMHWDENFYFFYPDSQTVWMLSADSRWLAKHLEKNGFSPSDTNRLLNKRYFNSGGLKISYYTSGKKYQDIVYLGEKKTRTYPIKMDRLGNEYTLYDEDLSSFLIRQTPDSIIVNWKYHSIVFSCNEMGDVMTVRDYSLFSGTHLWQAEYDNDLLKLVTDTDIERNVVDSYYFQYKYYE